MATPTSAIPSSFTLTLSPFTPAGSAPPSASSSTSYFPAVTPASASTSSNATEEAPCPFDLNADLRLPLALLYALFFLLGLVGNVLALWVFLFLQTPRRGPGSGGGVASRRPARHNSVRVLLINCAAADLVLLACLPFRVYYHLNGNRWDLGPLACRLVGTLFYMNMYISITLLGLIALDRCLRLSTGRGCGGGGGGGGGGGSSVGAPSRSLEGDGRLVLSWAVCGVIWLVSVVMMVVVVAMRKKDEVGQCFHYKQRLRDPGEAYLNLALVALFWAVFAALAVSYGRIAARLLGVSRAAPGLPNARRYGRTARKSFFVLFVFAVCFGPYHAFRPAYVMSQLDPALTCGQAAAVDRTNEVMLLLSAFNSCLDPVMYFLLSGSVRKSAVRVLAGRLCSKSTRFLNETTSCSSTPARRPSQPAAGQQHAVAAVTPVLAAACCMLEESATDGGEGWMLRRAEDSGA